MPKKKTKFQKKVKIVMEEFKEGELNIGKSKKKVKKLKQALAISLSEARRVTGKKGSLPKGNLPKPKKVRKKNKK